MALLRKDAWPFTRYPMFSRYFEVGDVRIIRFAFLGEGGERIWWKPRFFREVDAIGARITESQVGYLWAAGEVLRLAALDKIDLARFRFLEIVERRWDGAEAVDRSLARIALRG